MTSRLRPGIGLLGWWLLVPLSAVLLLVRIGDSTGESVRWVLTWLIAVLLPGTLLWRALAGEAYFAELRKYDDDLMSWSRTLGAKSEELRRATWPISRRKNAVTSSSRWDTRRSEVTSCRLTTSSGWSRVRRT